MQHRPAPSLFIAAALLACAPAVRTATSPTPLSNAPPMSVAAPVSTKPDASLQPLDDADRARQALNRLTFGARPGDLAVVERMGVKAWINLQLDPERIPDLAADSVLDLLEITHKSAFELAADHPQANEFGVIGLAQQLLQGRKDTAMRQEPVVDTTMSPMDQLASMRAKATRADERSTEVGKLGQLRSAATRELGPSILLRAEMSDRQLLEVMTVFWENHFSVSTDKVPFAFFLVDYDHAIRAHALGKFRDLLGAVATNPAMLLYLDNAQSTVDSLHPTQFEWQLEQRRAAHPPLGDTAFVHSVKRRRGTGINENYARELMELHTLGVDGGYTQRDVQEVARCLTGWGVENITLGGTFAFQAAGHDAGEKVVLGVHIPGGRGIEDGEEVLDILARHPSTAHFIAKKLVTHFVSDSPPPALVERAAQTYLRTDGDIREVMRTIITSPEFNSRAAYRAKVKTPFELVASIGRVMNAKPDTTQVAVQILTKLSQPIFGRATPDGWPDQGTAWMNAGALLNRVNLGVQVGASQFPNTSIATWKPTPQLSDMTADREIEGVIAALLSADASGQTLDAMRSTIAGAPPPSTHAQQLQRLGDLVAIAIGSSDFQRR